MGTAFMGNREGDFLPVIEQKMLCVNLFQLFKPVNREESMQKPKMILFDYGQTLVNEAKFDGVRGTEAVMKHAVHNKYNLTPQDVQNEADRINKELGRFDSATRHLLQVEVPNHMFTLYLYESLGIKLALTHEEIDRIFWNAAAPGTPTGGIEDFLAYLKRERVRTGVISNIAYCGNVVKERIQALLPANEFEFILATSEYLFRKPSKRIFELALEKAGLQAQDVWYIGDQYDCDIAGARNAGLFPVWYTGAVDMPNTKMVDVLTIGSWDELQGRMEGSCCLQ